MSAPPAELLRRAAQKLREHAERATAGPWVSERAFSTWFVTPDYADTTASGNVSRLKSTQRRDAEYIALMHPPVALALAEWLDSVYRDLITSHLPIWSGITGMDEAAIDAHMSGSEIFGPAFAVARAILREDD